MGISKTDEPMLDPVVLETMMRDAIEADDVDAIPKLAAQGASPNVEDGFGNPGICIAVERGSLPMLSALLSAGASPDAHARFREPALVGAVERGDISLVKALLDAGAKTSVMDRHGEAPLSKAIDAQNAEVVAALVAAGADVNAPDRFGDEPLAKVIGVEGPATPGMARALLKAPRLNPNGLDRFGDPHLSKAVDEGALGITRGLLAAGANMDAKDRFGRTCRSKAEAQGGPIWAAFELAEKRNAQAVTAQGARPQLPPLESLAERVARGRAGLAQASQEAARAKAAPAVSQELAAELPAKKAVLSKRAQLKRTFTG